jgi:AcrR family transcriptional regulator
MTTDRQPKSTARRRDNKPKRAPGRPRETSYDAVILREVLREISAHGFKRFSVQRVADAAGVAKATVRLRWPDRDQLIMAGLGTTSAKVSRPSTGSLRGDLAHIVHEYAEVYRSEEMMRLYGHLQAEQNDNPAFFEQFQSTVARPANQIVLDTIEEAQRGGEARGDIDAGAAARCLVGSLYLESISRRNRIGRGFEEQIVELIASAIEVEPQSKPRRRTSAPRKAQAR